MFLRDTQVISWRDPKILLGGTQKYDLGGDPNMGPKYDTYRTQVPFGVDPKNKLSWTQKMTRRDPKNDEVGPKK